MGRIPCRWAEQASWAGQNLVLADPRKQLTLLLEASLVLKIMEWKYTHNTNMPAKLSFQQLELKFFILLAHNGFRKWNTVMWINVALCTCCNIYNSESVGVIRSVICNEIVWWPAQKYLTEVLMERWSIWPTHIWQSHPTLKLCSQCKISKYFASYLFVFLLAAFL